MSHTNKLFSYTNIIHPVTKEKVRFCLSNVTWKKCEKWLEKMDGRLHLEMNRRLYARGTTPSDWIMSLIFTARECGYEGYEVGGFIFEK